MNCKNRVFSVDIQHQVTFIVNILTKGGWWVKSESNLDDSPLVGVFRDEWKWNQNQNKSKRKPQMVVHYLGQLELNGSVIKVEATLDESPLLGTFRGEWKWNEKQKKCKSNPR